MPINRLKVVLVEKGKTGRWLAQELGSHVEQEDRREKVDIEALNAQLAEIVSEGNALRHRVDEIVSQP